jgi:hypothetical protein
MVEPSAGDAEPSVGDTGDAAIVQVDIVLHAEFEHP